MGTTPSLKPILLLLLIPLLVSQVYGNWSNSVLRSGQTLKTGESLTYKCYDLKCQVDCNLVLYDNGESIWASNTEGLASDCYCTMQNDGDFVMYAPGGKSIWSSNTYKGGYNSYVLVLQDDRNVVIYGPGLWATKTNKVTMTGANNGTIAGPSSDNNSTTFLGAAATM